MSFTQEWVAEGLYRLANWTNSTGEAYFRGLVHGLADVLSVRWAYVSQIHPDRPGWVQVVGGWADGAPAENIEYDLDGTPCAEVLTGGTCFHPTGVAARFPRDRWLADLGVDSYAGTPLRTADGQVQGLLVVMHDRPMDVSQSPCALLELVAGRAASELERGRVEARLRQNEEQIRFLTESTPALLWRATADGRLDYLSPRAAVYCGVPIDSLLGFGYVAHMHPEDVPHKLRRWSRARETGEPFEAEYRLRGVDGVYRWQLTRGLPKRDASGKVVRWYGSVVDVDERRRAEEAQREADRRKDEFLAMLAHELRNPLAPIRHALSVQARSGDDLGAWREMRETMERQVAHLVRLVDDLLDVSRLTTGRITLQSETIDIREAIADAVETCRAILETKGHRTITRLSEDALFVHGDRIRLVQVLTNIVNNAAKFTDPGGAIEIVAGRAGKAVEIRVLDNGAGMSEERLSRVFELFSQSDAPPDRPHGGLGIGLTLSRRLIEMHAGALTASSAGPGRGSELRISLPAVEAPVHATPAQDAGGATPNALALNVLIIDDNVDATRALGRLLRVMGHVVSVAHDGKSGIELATRARPDVILLDIALPRMDGYSVARHLRSQPHMTGTRIIALTGYGHQVRERVRQAGIDGHLIKPVDIAELQAAICAPAG